MAIMENSIGLLKNQKQNYHIIQQSHFWVYIQRKQNPYLEEIASVYIHCSIIHDNRAMGIN